jgi:hypothetical protein
MIGNSKPKVNSINAEAWRERAPELAQWTRQHLLCRSDCWGAYTPLDRRGKTYTRKDGTIAKVPVNFTKHGHLTGAILIQHYRGERPEHLVGTHTTGWRNTSRWCAFDIDNHGQGDACVNRKTAYALYDHLRDRYFTPLLTSSNGVGGYHLRVLFAKAVPTRDVHSFLQHVAAEVGFEGEQFPKQPTVAADRFGNWLRLPGRHHTRDHWSEVYDGERWLNGEESIKCMLEFTGDSPSLVPAAPSVERPPRTPPPPPRTAPSPSHRHYHRTGRLADQIEKYRLKLPNLSEGQGRDDVAFQFAAFLVRDMQVTDAVALEWLSLWDAGNSPPKGDERLREIVLSAHQYGQHSYGSGRSK